MINLKTKLVAVGTLVMLVTVCFLNLHLKALALARDKNLLKERLMAEQQLRIECSLTLQRQNDEIKKYQSGMNLKKEQMKQISDIRQKEYEQRTSEIKANMSDSSGCSSELEIIKEDQRRFLLR